jgi:hypothetical protein
MSAICQKASQAGRKPKSRCNLIRLRNKTGENRFFNLKKARRVYPLARFCWFDDVVLPEQLQHVLFRCIGLRHHRN